MAESYKIFDLDIDYSKLVSSTAEAKTRIAGMKEELAQMKKEGKDNTEEFVKLDAQMKVVSAEVRQNTKLMTDSIQAGNGQNATIEEMRKALSVVSVQWSKLSEEEANNTEEGKKLSAQKLDLTNRLKVLEAATGDNRRNVGNYTDSMKGATQALGAFGGPLGEAVGKLNAVAGSLATMKEGLTKTSEGTGKAGGAFSTFNNILKASVIGAIIAVILLLVQALMKLDPVMDRIEQLTAGLTAAFNVVVQTIVKFISGVTSVGDAMSKLGNAILHPIDTLKELGSSMKKAADEASNLKAQQQDLADAMSIQEVASAKANQQIKELIVQSKNRSLSEQERIALLEKASQMEEDDFNKRVDLANQDIKLQTDIVANKGQLTNQEIQKLQELGTAYANTLMNNGKISEEEYEAFKKAELAKVAIMDESTQRQEKIQNQQDALAEKAKAAAEKAQKDAEAAEQKRQARLAKERDDMLQQKQDVIDYYDAVGGKELKSESDIAKSYQRKADLLKLQLDTQKITETKYNAEVAKLYVEFEKTVEETNKKRLEESMKLAEAELEIFRKQHQSRIDDNTVLNDTIVQQEVDRLMVEKEKTDELNRQKFEQGLITSQEYMSAQLDAEEQFNTAQLELAKKYDEQKKEAAAINTENDLQLKILQGQSEYDTQRQQAQQNYEAEVAEAEKVHADTSKIKAKYSEINKKIDKAEKENQLRLTADAFGQISELLGKNSAAGKAFAIAQAGINTYLGVSQILAAPPSGPEPFNTILKGVSIATTIATGVANVAKIAAIKAERGGKFGTVGGHLHSQGGTKYYGDDGNVIEMERDENFYVLNRGASRAINSLSALNQHYGGVGFSTPVRSGYFADGGMLSRSMVQTAGGGPEMMDAIVSAVGAIRPIVDVKDIITGVDNRVSLVDGSNV